MFQAPREEDETGSEDGDVVEDPPLAPGAPSVQVVVGAAGDSGDEDEEEEEEGVVVDEPVEAEVRVASAPLAAAATDARLLVQGAGAPSVQVVVGAAGDSGDEDEEEEEEGAVVDEPVEAEVLVASAPLAAAAAAARLLVQGAGDTAEDAEMEGGEEEAEEPEEEPNEEAQAEAEAAAARGAMSAAAAAARRLVQGAADEPEEDEEMADEGEAAGALVRAEDTAGEATELSVVSLESQGSYQHQSESLGLPVEANNSWTVANDFCTLQVAGKVMKLPRSVYERLYPYQRQGVAWMWNLFHKRFGGILGDEMGLGKTVQSAAFLACLKCTDQGRYFLVVMPVTLMEQWKRELTSWARDTGLAVHIYHGTPMEKQKALLSLRRRGGVLLTSYEMFRSSVNFLRTAGLACAASAAPRKRKRQNRRATRDDDSPSEKEEEQVVLPADDPHRPWDVVLVDEGQTIKNPSCTSGKALRKIDALSRVVLTGTPLSNKLSDLWALMDFAQPSLLGNHATFEQSFANQIAKGSHKNASKFDVELKIQCVKELRRLTGPHFLRRMKCEVCLPTNGTEIATRTSSSSSAAVAAADEAAPEAPASQDAARLPKKVDVVFFLKLTPAQTELYNLYLQSDVVARATGAEKCGIEALRAISVLKAICGHPMLCLPQEELERWKCEVQGGRAPAEGAAGGTPAEAPLFEEDASTQPAAECKDLLSRVRALVPGSVHGAQLLSCKLRVLSVLLPQLHKRGHRCVIFAETRGMLDLIQVCVLRVLGLRFLRIDGTIDPRDRDVKVAKFQAPDSRYFAVCMTVQTGGTGLTITAADRVILVNPHWNPMVDAQAVDRVHRIGQKKDVVVYRLVGAGAMEDKMFRLQVFKGSVSKAFLNQQSTVRFFTKKDLKALFERPDESVSTQALMSAQIGQEAFEHADLLSVVMADVGDVQDSQAEAFWQSSDVEGFSDYQRLFMFLEQMKDTDEEAQARARKMSELLQTQKYIKDQVVDGRFRHKDQKSELAKDIHLPVTDELAPLHDAAASGA